MSKILRPVRTALSPDPFLTTDSDELIKLDGGGGGSDIPPYEDSDPGSVLTNIGTGHLGWVPSHYVPSGGTSGQVLKKLSNADHAYGWANDEGAPVRTSTYFQALSITTDTIAVDVPEDASFFTAQGSSYSNTVISYDDCPDKTKGILDKLSENVYENLYGVNVRYTYPSGATVRSRSNCYVVDPAAHGAFIMNDQYTNPNVATLTSDVPYSSNSFHIAATHPESSEEYENDVLIFPRQLFAVKPAAQSRYLEFEKDYRTYRIPVPIASSGTEYIQFDLLIFGAVKPGFHMSIYTELFVCPKLE